ncbi:hypothetical protein, partial [Streptomyces sp. DfronAA-171]|uniref:hypothetical protein n=1 Tax=Streptomyces sp. DfronAA-171 TaxID=1839777 RepID=UPI00081E0A1C
LTAEEPAGPVDGGPGGHSPTPAEPGPDGLPAEPAPLPATERPAPDDGSREWPCHADLALGDHLLRQADPFDADAAVNPSRDGFAVEYNRPPRIAPHLDTESMRMQGPPGERKNRPFRSS